MKKKNLQNLLENLLQEDVPAPQPKNMQSFSTPETPLNVSLDQAVDRYIIRYEKESIPTMSTYEDQINNYSTNAIEKLLENLLNEAPEDEVPTEDTPATDTGGDESVTNITDAADTTDTADITDTNDANDNEQQTVMATPQINLQDFTRSIARLVNNFEALINPKEIIINRAKEYIKNNYDTRTAEEFSELLSNNYNITTMSDMEDQNNNWPTSYTAGALSSEG